MPSPRHFDTFGVIVYNPERSLLPSTVIPENFALTTYTGRTVEIADVEYYKQQNKVLLYPEEPTVGQPSYQLSANPELKFLDGSTPIIADGEFVQSIPVADEVYGVSVARVTYKKNGAYLYDLSGITDFDVTFDVANATGEAQNGIQYTVLTDESGYVVEKGLFDMGKDEETTISTVVSGYTMEPGENVVLIFGE